MVVFSSGGGGGRGLSSASARCLGAQLVLELLNLNSSLKVF